MARTTKAERKRRREAALVKISEGHGFADTVTFVMQEWWCSRSTARRDCHWAHGELQLGLDAHDAQHLVTHLWKVHGVPGEAIFNGRVIKFPEEDSDK